MSLFHKERRLGKAKKHPEQGSKVGPSDTEERLVPKGGLKKLGWLSMAQQSAYVSIITAMKVLHKCEPERLYDLLTEVKNEGSVRKKSQQEEICKVKGNNKEGLVISEPQVVRTDAICIKKQGCESKDH